MPKLKTVALAAGAVARSASLPRGEPAATVLLHHRVFRPGEPKSKAVDRLRRQLHWLRSAYRPIGVPELAARVAAGDMLDRSVVVTTDDAMLDVIEVTEELRQFEVPLAVFVCAGWVACVSVSLAKDLLMHLVTRIQWNEGEECPVEAGSRLTLRLTASSKSVNIGFLIENWTDVISYAQVSYERIEALPELARQRSFCSWSDLQELSSLGIYLGAHSVSHVLIAQMSAVRQRFEITDCMRTLRARFGSPTAFAYPYGTRGTYNALEHLTNHLLTMLDRASRHGPEATP